jgi:hypothetical protein
MLRLRPGTRKEAIENGRSVAEPFFGCTGRLATQRGTQPFWAVRPDGVVQT